MFVLLQVVVAVSNVSGALFWFGHMGGSLLSIPGCHCGSSASSSLCGILQEFFVGLGGLRFLRYEGDENFFSEVLWYH